MSIETTDYSQACSISILETTEMSTFTSSSSKRQKKESVEVAHIQVLSNNPKFMKSPSSTASNATSPTPTLKMESHAAELSTDLLLIKKESLRKKLIAFGSLDSNNSSLCCDSLMGSASEQPVNNSSATQSPRGLTDKGLTKPGKLFQWDYLLKEMVSCKHVIVIAFTELLLS